MTEVNGTPAPETPAGGTPETPVFSPVVQELMSKKNWKTIDDLATGYIEVEKFSKSDPARQVIWPADEKDETGWNNIFNRLGRPETPDKYKFENKTGIDIDAETLKEFNAMAHKQGFSQKQYEAGLAAHLNVFKNLEAKVIKQSEIDFAACDKALKEKWGTDHPKRAAAAIDMADKLKVKDLLVKKKLDNDPEILEMLDTFVSMTSEGTLKPAGGDNTKTPEQELKEIQENPAFTNNMHPDHDAVMKRYMQLFGVKV